MSQEKVNKYKEEKANRKEILKRQRRNRIIARTIGVVVAVAIVGWIGYSAVATVQKKIATAQTEIDISALQTYLSGLAPTVNTGDDTADTTSDTTDDAGDTTSEDAGDTTSEDAGDTTDDADTTDGADTTDDN